jgi:Glutathione S-transferase, N-terminal domain
MTLALYFHPFASFCQKVVIALYENDTPFEGHIVNLGDEASAADFKRLWPIGKMPVLRDEDLGHRRRLQHGRLRRRPCTVLRQCCYAIRRRAQERGWIFRSPDETPLFRPRRRGGEALLPSVSTIVPISHLLYRDFRVQVDVKVSLPAGRWR